ncbi:MAG: hypothetical protein M5U34_32110 [Chloroflexi bacterium]|nr:hypothetical protein [Chloroflexota bacterium]
MTDLLHCTEGENRSQRSCNEIDELMRQAGQIIDAAERETLYRRIENLLFADGGDKCR